VWNTTLLPPLPTGFEYRLDLSKAATPRLLKKRPRHRWFWFPHSYSPELIESILDEWELPRGSNLLDPFVGSGTTLLVAKERGMQGTGVDLSPLAIRVSRAKVADYDLDRLAHLGRAILDAAKTSHAQNPSINESSNRLMRAFSKAELSALASLRQAIHSFESEEEEKDFFLLVLLSTAKAFSRAVASGGWFKWVEREESPPEEVFARFEALLQKMLVDVDLLSLANDPSSELFWGDARQINQFSKSFDGLITSPPYPNRHDYTRVFHIELLLLGENDVSIKRLRKNMLRSHVEAEAPENVAEGYVIPHTLESKMAEIEESVDRRVLRMLKGYFEDMYTLFRNAHSVLKPTAKLAFVVGNVRYAGVEIPVDQILAEVAEHAGFTWNKTWVIRLRGNSAQQMKLYGRVPMRESIVFLSK